MAMFRYTAKNAQGEETAGVVDAASLDDALVRLLQRGLRDVQVTHLPGAEGAEGLVFAEEVPGSQAGPQATGSPFATPPVSLSAGDATELATQVAHVSAAKLPLAAGLRAAADETANRRVAMALQWIADQTDQGRSLEDTLAHSGKLLPTYVTGLILAAARTGRLGEALFELAEQQQSLHTVRYNIRQGFGYSLIVVAFAVPVLLFIVGYVTGQFVPMFEEFELRLPAMTRLLFWWHDDGLRILGYLILAMVALAALVRLVAGRARWQRFTSTLPLFGAMWQAMGMAEWSGLLSVLLRHEIPLPSALRLAGHGIRNAHIGDVSLRLADGVARGRSLSQLMYAYPELPATLIPLVEWGERAGALSESLRVGREMAEKRAVTRGTLVVSIISPLLFLWIAAVVMFVVTALFMPLIDLVSMLS